MYSITTAVDVGNWIEFRLSQRENALNAFSRWAKKLTGESNSRNLGKTIIERRDKMHWSMVVDLKLCIGCNSCVIACKMGNGTSPGIFWDKVLEQEVGTFPSTRRIFWSVRCMHCEEPACLDVCPTGATYQREDKLVLIDANKCIGCKACILACPYDARSLWDGKGSYFEDGGTPYEVSAYVAHVPGAVQKCDFCASRLDKGLQPYCVEVCPTEALIFGDLDDPNSNVSRALGEARLHLQLKEELGTHPSVYYLT